MNQNVFQAASHSRPQPPCPVAADAAVCSPPSVVAAAKRLVFGEVNIDSIAGPSEILLLADD